MSLKSFDDFCARIVNNDPVQQKDIFDERQSIVRSQITIRALWAFIIMSGINIIIMECGPQWCESWVLSTAFFGALAYLYWVIANARRGSLFGINGTMTVTMQAGMFFADGCLLPFVLFSKEEDADLLTNFVIRNGMVSEYFIATLGGVLLIVAGFVMLFSARKHKKSD